MSMQTFGNCEEDHLHRLVAELNAMQQSATLTDVTLLCGEREFQAHKIVLTSISPYFHSALTNGWMEMTSGYINLPMISAESMETILAYMYTGQFKVGAKDQCALMDLVQNSDYLQIEGLVQVSFCYLAQLRLTTEDFTEMYDYVLELGNQILINHVVEFLGKNYVDVSRSPDFLVLTTEQLERIVHYANKDRQASMEDIFTSILQWTASKSERVELLEHWMNVLETWCMQCLYDLKLKNVLMPWNPEIVNSLTEKVGSDPGHKQTKKLLVFGKTTSHSVLTVYDVEANKWCTTQVLPFILKNGVDAVVYRCHAYFFGGGHKANTIRPSTAVIKYCPFKNTVQLNSEKGLAYPVYAAGTGVLNDLIYIVNGVDEDYSILTTVQRYDPRDDTCQPVASTNKRHDGPTVMSFSGSLYIVGSVDNGDRYLERYDVAADQWTVVTEIPGTVDCCAVAICDAKLFVVREYGETMFHVYDFNCATWTLSAFYGVPAIVDWLWATMKGGRPILFYCDFVENVVHQYDVKSSMWVAKSVGNRNLGTVTTCCKLWSD